MMKNIFSFLILIFLISCNHKKSNLFISVELIDSISTEVVKYTEGKKNKKHIKPNYVNLPVFIKLNNNSFIESNPVEMYHIYNRVYKDSVSKFNFFLDEVVNNGYKLNKNDFEEKPFNLDYTIIERFKEFEFKDFLNYYSMKDEHENKSYLNKKIRNGNEYLTISYLLFTKGYYLGEDDFRGRSYIYKFDDVIKK
jgi:hypothetical protein